ncbi:MAG: HAMP domain-containing sensor histidine kinase [Bacteroidales bacterium]|nr:HAMP domain-containing sensor histidine kinase [Bacteroidales bacterium]
MKRWKLFGLISLMLISLLGIIWVQLIWIQDAIAVQRDLFNRSVYQSLHTTARKIESNRNIEFYKRMMVADSTLKSKASNIITNPFSPLVNDQDNFNNLQIPQLYGVHESFSVRVTDDGNNVVFSGDMQTTVTTDSGTYISSPNTTENYLIHSPVDREIVVQEDKFQEWIIKKSNELRNLGDQMISELANWEMDTEVDNGIVYSTLLSELANSGISTPFEYALIENNRVLSGHISEFSESDLINSGYTVELFPNRLIRNNTRLSLQFPDQSKFVLGKMVYMLAASSLFSLIILFTFALSIYFIIRQKKISEMKSDFINNMTHEFKTPIATISLAADTIANPKIINKEDQVRHFIGMIKKENVRMNKQVENILQISTLEKSEMEFSFELVNINKIIERSIETIEIQVQGKGGNIFFYPEAISPEINGDPEHLTNLIHNLLDNANKYSTSNPEITVRTQTSGTSLKLSVEDKGMGMTKSVQSKIFERFYREASGNIHNVKGFGLGLSYVRAIVEAHHGSIQVWSEPEKGTRFDVYLPQNTNCNE